MFFKSARPRASEGNVKIAIIAIFMVLFGSVQNLPILTTTAFVAAALTALWDLSGS
jgi:hypothetical protein